MAGWTRLFYVSWKKERVTCTVWRQELILGISSSHWRSSVCRYPGSLSKAYNVFHASFPIPGAMPTFHWTLLIKS
jgi:hypothetical protein